jgi:hypothetical protein
MDIKLRRPTTPATGKITRGIRIIHSGKAEVE